jgi:hypothetical protein
MRICYQCEHLTISNYAPGYSDVTPSLAFELYCGKGHWELDTAEASVATLQTLLEMAETCNDFKARKYE